MDLMYKVPCKKFDPPLWTRYIKYVVLAALVVALPFFLGEDTPLSFCRICPASAVQVTMPNLVTGGFSQADVGTWVKLGILAGVLVLAMMSRRSFCKMLCPIGAMLGPLNYVSLWAINTPMRRPCTGCKKCDRVCPTDSQPFSRITAGAAPNRSAECIVCHDCQHACPQRPVPPAA